MKRTPLKRKTSLKRCKPDTPKGKLVPKKRKATPKPKAPTTKAVDKLWSLVIRERANYECQLWGCGGMQCATLMDAHHVCGRGFAVRWDTRNGLCLCKAHHQYFVHSANRQAAAQKEIEALYEPGVYADLLARHYQTGKNTAAFRTQMYAELSAELKRLKELAA